MANIQYVSRNSFIIKARKIRIKITSIWLLFTLATIIPLYFILIDYIAHIIAFLLVLLFIVFQKFKSAGYLERVSGQAEVKAFNNIKKLPKQFVIFNQLEIPSERSKFGHFELDLVVVSPTGIYIIKAKRFSGKIIGGNNDTWLSVKFDKKGNKYSRPQTINPIHQLALQRDIVREYLDYFGINTSIRCIIFLDNPQKDSEFSENIKFPIFSNKKIIKYIKEIEKESEISNGKNKNIENYYNIKEIFRLLKKGTIL